MAYNRELNWLIEDDDKQTLPDMTPAERRAFAIINRMYIDDYRLIDGVSVWRLSNCAYMVGRVRIRVRGANVARVMLDAAREVLRQQEVAA